MKKISKLFAYPGGKWTIRNTVISFFPPEHITFVDLFGGAASILIAKDKSIGEVFNDKNAEIINFFRVVKHRAAELAERAQLVIHSRRVFNEWRDLQPPYDEVEQALRFWYLTADSFGARGRHFGTCRAGIHSVTHARKHLLDVSQRLADVHIECLDFTNCISAYDAPGTFFYADPPYRDTKGGSTHYDTLTDDEWVELRSRLGSISGKFLLSSNDHPFVLKIFNGYHVRHLNVPVTLPRKKSSQTRREVLIANYPLNKSCND